MAKYKEVCPQEIHVKRSIIIILIISLLLVPFPVQAAEPNTIPGNESFTGGAFIPSDAPEITGTTGIVMDMDTGDILYEKDCHRRAEPASTTKLLTAILAVDNLNPSDLITVKDGALEGISYDAVRIWLSPGETMPVSDLLYALLLPSANDAANVLAMAVAGTVPSFVVKMNETAEALGCKDTHFTNANGLPDPQHYTTAYDMALIARAAYSRSRIRDVLATPAYWIPATNMAEERELWTTNYLLYDVTDVYYDACTGGKTGYTEEAGNCMVAFAEKYGRRLVSVVFHCPGPNDRFIDSKALLEFCFEEYHRIHPLEGFTLSGQNDKDANDPVSGTSGEGTSGTSETGTSDKGSTGTSGLSTAVLGNYYARLPHALPEYSVDTSLSIYARSSVAAGDIQKEITLKLDKYKGTAGEVKLTYLNRALATIPILMDRTRLDEDLETLAAMEAGTIRPRGDGNAELPATRSEILRSVLEESIPRLMFCILAAALLVVGTVIIAHFRRKRRVRISRYFGDGPVAAVDPEAAAAEEERKKAREALRRLEDSGVGTPRPKPAPGEKHPTDDGIVDSGERVPRHSVKPVKEPDTTKQPESTKKPESTKQPESTKKPVSTKQPETIDDIEDSGEKSAKRSRIPSTKEKLRKKRPAESIDDITDEG